MGIVLDFFEGKWECELKKGFRVKKGFFFAGVGNEGFWGDFEVKFFWGVVRGKIQLLEGNRCLEGKNIYFF